MSSTTSLEKIKLLCSSDDKYDAAVELLQVKRYSEAEALLHEAFSERSAAVGTEDPGLVEILDQIGLVYLQTGRAELAVEPFNQAVSILEKNFYPGHGLIAPVLNHLGDAFISLNKPEEAEASYRRGLEISEKTLSGEHRLVFELSLKLASALNKLTKYNDAEKVLTKAIKFLDTPLGPLEEFQHQLGLIYKELGKSDEAENYLRKAVEGYEQRKNYPRLGDCLKDLALLLKEIGKPEEADHLLKRATLMQGLKSSATPDIFTATLLRP